MTRLPIAVALAALAMSASGCATVVRGTETPFTVSSTPSGADVEMTNGHRCTTPCTLSLPRKNGFDVRISKPGYRTVHASVVSGASGEGSLAMAGNVLVGGVIGVGVDAATGATNDLTPNPLSVFLEPGEAGS